MYTSKKASSELELSFCLMSSGQREEPFKKLNVIAFLLIVEVSLSITGAFNLVHLPFVSTGWPEKTGSHRCKWKGQGRSVGGYSVFE